MRFTNRRSSSSSTKLGPRTCCKWRRRQIVIPVYMLYQFGCEITINVSGSTLSSSSFSELSGLDCNKFLTVGNGRYGSCTRGVQVKLWDPLRTHAIPERLWSRQGAIQIHVYLTLPYLTFTNLLYRSQINCAIGNGASSDTGDGSRKLTLNCRLFSYPCII